MYVDNGQLVTLGEEILVNREVFYGENGVSKKWIFKINDHCNKKCLLCIVLFMEKSFLFSRLSARKLYNLWIFESLQTRVI